MPNPWDSQFADHSTEELRQILGADEEEDGEPGFEVIGVVVQEAMARSTDLDRNEHDQWGKKNKGGEDDYN
ncbi:hypothetical protein NM208_g432 [Fusarium decemcellulare]|uniref:Uncharacterized protein n=1 Tax=Fusarium decemcellulare TaxID=57161 RepID=A0ACC1SZP7_9HYPO|nr:hypothetical protein NM208_g432 [Fusarium decemcellulare]